MHLNFFVKLKRVLLLYEDQKNLSSVVGGFP